MELITALTPFKYGFLIYVIIYGMAFGFSNTLNRIKWLFADSCWTQSDMGKVLDSIFWFSCIISFFLI